MLGDFPLPSTPARKGGRQGKQENAVKRGLSRVTRGKRHTSDRQTLLPGFVRCLGISLEPKLCLGMDLIAVWLHRGEGLDRDILNEGVEQGKRLPAHLGPSLEWH